MDMEKFGELMKAKEPGPWPEFEGIRYPPAPPFREKGVEKALQDILHFQSRESDLLICTYPKSDFKGSWDDFFEIWMSDKGFYGSWYNYEKEMEKAEKLYPGMILTCYYEKMKKDSTTEIKRLADFLGIQCTESTLKDIAYATSFQNMQQHNMHKLDSSKELDGKGFIYRKGEIGDWKNHFTVAQNERFEEQYTERFKDSTYKLTFE
ncbi:sulfotransferase 1C4-like isoform X2 [Mytilus californianus]|uniref:sulfotransferase 1C4-like isoform X2 n=1 Tax=Mytilus californianus TaxID=6549 RepID=UPI00224562DA|nr:sulfotransferase 1C4-like isoform X2 [Mytilus californianus]